MIDIRNLFEYGPIRNIFRFKKNNKVIKDRIPRDIRNLFEHEEGGESYYKIIRTSNFWSNSYIEYESKGDRNKTLSVEKYLNKIKPYLKYITNNFKKSDTQKIKLRIASNFISSKDNDEERVMHSKSDNIEIMINDEADEVTKKLFKSLTKRYQNNLEKMKGSEFVFNYVDFLYYKCHKIHPNCCETYIDSPSWVENKKPAINPFNKKNSKCFQYAATKVI